MFKGGMMYQLFGRFRNINLYESTVAPCGSAPRRQDRFHHIHMAMTSSKLPWASPASQDVNFWRIFLGSLHITSKVNFKLGAISFIIACKLTPFGNLYLFSSCEI